MKLDSLREYCLSFPDATENVQWGADLVFKVFGKMFTVACLEPGLTKVSFKCTPEEFAELVEREDISPADYVARYHWVTLHAWDALPAAEIRRLVGTSYELVRAKSKGRGTKAKATGTKVTAAKASAARAPRAKVARGGVAGSKARVRTGAKRPR